MGGFGRWPKRKLLTDHRRCRRTREGEKETAAQSFDSGGTLRRRLRCPRCDFAYSLSPRRGTVCGWIEFAAQLPPPDALSVHSRVLFPALNMRRLLLGEYFVFLIFFSCFLTSIYSF